MKLISQILIFSQRQDAKVSNVRVAAVGEGCHSTGYVFFTNPEGVICDGGLTDAGF